MVLPTEFISNHNPGAGLYVDIENLQGNAQELIGSLIQDWPSEVPHLSRIVLYVRADLVTLWEMWALTLDTDGEVEVKGIQHFSLQGAKNSADIALAVDAAIDFVRGRICYVAVFSDDSDFIALFTKVKSETKEVQESSGRVPFLWILTDRAGTKTPNIRQFFPSDYLYIVRSMPDESVSLAGSHSVDANTESEEEDIALAIIRALPIGTFKAVDCQEVVKQQFPEHPGARQGGAAFGEYIAKSIWPHLERRGVRLVSQRPRSYEMTQAAKNSLPA